MSDGNVAFKKGTGCCSFNSYPAFIDMHLADALVLIVVYVIVLSLGCSYICFASISQVFG